MLLLKRKMVSAITFTLLLAGTLTLAFNIQAVKASGTIYIRADGSIDPSTAPIATSDNITYALADDIDASIMIERDGVSVDGANHSLLGPGSGSGIDLSGRNNVTIKNFDIRNFYRGFNVANSLNNSIIENNITNNAYGIFLAGSSGNIIIGNSFTNDGLFVYYSFAGRPVNIVQNNTVNGKPLIYLENVSGHVVADAGQVILVGCSNIQVQNLDTSNTTVGVELWQTSYSEVVNNSITSNNQYGICLLQSSNNNDVSANNIANSNVGINLRDSSSNNRISSNSISNSTLEGILSVSSSNNNITGNRITASGDYAIYLANSYVANVSENSVTGNIKGGIFLTVSNDNDLFGNNITSNNVGISMEDSCHYNTISENDVANNGIGVNLRSSSSNTITANNVTNCSYGISLSESSDNRIYHNNFIDNTNQVYDYSWNSTGYADSVNTWDNFYPSFYPSGGNYWSNYNGTDFFSGPNQNETGSDGIGDTAYVIDANNTDLYPLMVQYVIPEFSTFLVLPLFMIAIFLAVTVCKRRRVA